MSITEKNDKGRSAARMVAEGAMLVIPDLLDPDEPLAGARYVRCDITDAVAVEEVHRSIEREEGRVDVLVNNAGNQSVALTDVSHPAEWEQVIRVHLFGSYCSCRLALRTMKRQQRGAIVTIASVAGLIALPGRGPYSAAKAALMSLTRVIAVEVADQGIRVNAVAPGMARTSLVDAGIENGSIDLDTMLSEIPESLSSDSALAKTLKTFDQACFGMVCCKTRESRAE